MILRRIINYAPGFPRKNYQEYEGGEDRFLNLRQAVGMKKVHDTLPSTRSYGGK